MSRKKRKQQEEAEREELLSPDAFQQQGSEVAPWFEKNLRLIVAGIVGVLAAIVLVEFLGSQGTRAASEVTAELGDAVDTYRDARDPNFVRTATSSDLVQTKRKEAAAELSQFRNDHSGTGPARLALMYEADLRREAGEHEAALELYDEYLSAAGSSDPLRFLALENGGYSAEDAGQMDRALEYFRRLEDLEFYANYARKHQARILKAQGKVEEAVKALEKIVDSEPSPYLKNYAEGELRVLRS